VDNRQENDRAWRANVADLLRYDGNGVLLSANPDLKNPNAGVDLEHLPPERLAADILDKERRIIEIISEIKSLLEVKSP
jgi:type I restriction enzyme M protein